MRFLNAVIALAMMSAACSDEVGSPGGSSGASGSDAGGTGGTGGSEMDGGAGSAGDSGGAGGAGPQCEPDNPQFTVCERCRDSKCCSEWLACLEDGEPCSEGGSMGEGEIICIQGCIIDEFEMNASADPVAVRAACADSCATDGVLITTVTNALFTCLDATDGCALECFGN